MHRTVADPTTSTHARTTAAHRFVDGSLMAYALAGGAVVASATTADAAVVASGPLWLVCPSAGSPVGNGGNGGAGAVAFGWGGNGGNGGNGGSAGLLSWDHDTVNDHSVVLVTAAPGSSLELARVGSSNFAYRFGFGEAVGSGGNGGNGGMGGYDGGPTSLAAYDSANWHVAGLGHQWILGSSGYLGFRFMNDSGNYLYGWIELIVPMTAAAGEPVTLVQWAYQDDPNGEIYAGVVPAPGTAAVAALAAGTLGLSGRRRERRRAE